jgi:hypothetical protein
MKKIFHLLMISSRACSGIIFSSTKKSSFSSGTSASGDFGIYPGLPALELILVLSPFSLMKSPSNKNLLV